MAHVKSANVSVAAFNVLRAGVKDIWKSSLIRAARPKLRQECSSGLASSSRRAHFSRTLPTSVDHCADFSVWPLARVAI
jgi:hypothetical protein